MQGEIVSSDQQPKQDPLGERLDATIGETSNGIGALLSELVRRSLKAGVSDIGESLLEYAEDQVEAAVQQQMPAIAEAADEVAQSTSRRVAKQAVDEFGEQTAKQHQILESRIDAAETNAIDRSRSHVEEVLTGVNESIDQTRNLAVEGNDTSQRKIDELREKARLTWRKLKDEFSTVNDAHKQLRKEHERLSRKFVEVCEQHRQEVEAAETRFSQLARQNQQLEERLAILEQPKGIKGLFAKFRGGRKPTKAGAEQQIEITEDIDAAESPENEA